MLLNRQTLRFRAINRLGIVRCIFFIKKRGPLLENMDTLYKSRCVILFHGGILFMNEQQEISKPATFDPEAISFLKDRI